MHSDIVFTLQFDDLSANSLSNNKLAQGWKLLHVGQQINEDGYTYTCYVVGATKELYDAYLKQEKETDQFFEKFRR